MTQEQIRIILDAIQFHPDCEEIIEKLEETICFELELSGHLLLEAYLSNNVDGMLNAFTGWGIQALLEKAEIIPNISGVMVYDQKPERVTFKVMPWEENRNKKELIQNEGKSESS